LESLSSFPRRRLAAALMIAAAGCSGRGPTPPTPIVPPLQMTCPADDTVHGVLGTRTYTFAPPVTTGGSGPVSVTCSPASGTAFGVGTTMVNCTASDAAGRQASCSFNVSLVGVQLSVTKYTAFGDSLTEGENALLTGPLFVDIPNAYPTRLQAQLEASYPGQGVTVVNRGQGGERLVDDGLIRLSSVLAADKPGALLVFDGYNDLSVCGFFTADTPECGAAINSLGFGIRDAIRKAREAPNNIRYVFVGTLTPPGIVSPGAPDRRRAPEAILRTNDRIRTFAASEGAALVDIYPLFLGHEREYVSVDGLHLTASGNQVIADAFFSAIQTAVPQTSPVAPRLRRAR
jgi:lysophospholipase L1-like esterase